MQHICSMCGVVVGVGGVVAGFDELQPGAQRSLCAVQELTHAKTSEDLQPEVGERSAGLQHSVGTYRLLANSLRSIAVASFSSFNIFIIVAVGKAE